MEFTDKLFALIHGLPVADEPMAHLESGPSEPGAFQKFHEQVVFDHAMGKSSSPAAADVPALEKFLAPRDSRDFGEPIMPRSGGDLAKRFTATIDTDESDEEVIEEYSHGRVVAKLRNGIVTSTVYIPKE
jgi:hypothetical protein